MISSDLRKERGSYCWIVCAVEDMEFCDNARLNSSFYFIIMFDTINSVAFLRKKYLKNNLNNKFDSIEYFQKRIYFFK